MNYVHHALIGVGTACLGVIAAEAVGTSPVPPVLLGIGAVAAATGSIATDLDHPRSFISHSIPSHIIRIALAVLAIPILSGVAVLLTTHDLVGTWNQLSAFVLGWNILRWSLFAIVSSLGLIAISYLLYKSLHHRGPLHSLLFALMITSAACLALALLKQPWAWGLVFGWGWLWHILADGLTKEGVPFFWPLNDDRLHTLPTWICKAAAWILSLASAAGIVALILLKIGIFSL